MCAKKWESLLIIIYGMYYEIIYLIYMYQKNLALNNLQWLIYKKKKQKKKLIPGGEPSWCNG